MIIFKDCMDQKVWTDLRYVCYEELIFDYIILRDCEGFLNCWFLIFSFSWLEILIVECFLECSVWASNYRLWSVELLRESQCFLVECRIVERTCRSLGRLKDVELWRGKNLQKPLVDLRI